MPDIVVGSCVSTRAKTFNTAAGTADYNDNDDDDDLVYGTTIEARSGQGACRLWKVQWDVTVPNPDRFIGGNHLTFSEPGE